MANWEEVPQELLELIAQRLAIEDFLAFGMVCTSWRSAAVKETYNAKSKAPWLMTYVHNQRPEFFDPSRERIYQVEFPCIQAKTLPMPGWILVSIMRHEYRIFNPLSGIGMELPSLEKLRHMSCLGGELGGWEPDKWEWEWFLNPRINSIALSSSPSLSRSYMVMISIHWDLAKPGLAFHRSGEDAWTVVSPANPATPWYLVRELIYYNGLFVALDTRHHITTLNEREGRMELRLVLGQSFEGCPYLVECRGSLLAVWKIRREGYGFQVFEVDLEKGTQEEVRSLGNASVFLNENASSSFSVVFNDESCLPGIKPNHIYFTDYTDYIDKKKSYDMDSGRLERCDGATSHLYATKWFQPGF